jgi:hypothetical protein
MDLHNCEELILALLFPRVGPISQIFYLLAGSTRTDIWDKTCVVVDSKSVCVTDCLLMHC